MSRKEKRITIQDRGRSLTFVIREMAATQLESWIIRCLLLLVKAGISSGIGNSAGLENMAQEVREGNYEQAMSYISTQGLSALLSKVNYEDAAPLLDELLGCCSRVVDGITQPCTDGTIDSYVFDFRTIFKLRAEAFMLNCGFFMEEAAPAAEVSKSRPEQSQIRISKGKRG